MYKIISSRKSVDLFNSLFKKDIRDVTTSTFQEVGGVTQPSCFVEGIIFSHYIALTITTLIDFHSQCIFTILFATVFN